jgi:hypothetical protein
MANTYKGQATHTILFGEVRVYHYGILAASHSGFCGNMAHNVIDLCIKPSHE